MENSLDLEKYLDSKSAERTVLSTNTKLKLGQNLRTNKQQYDPHMSYII